MHEINVRIAKFDFSYLASPMFMLGPNGETKCRRHSTVCC